MQISSLFRRTMALGVVGVSVFVVTGCQSQEDKPAPLPDIKPAATTPAPKTATSSATTKADSSSPGAHQPKFGEK